MDWRKADSALRLDKDDAMRNKNVSGWACLIPVFLGTSLKVQAQTWSFTGSMLYERTYLSATLVNNGGVLVAGGRDRGDYNQSGAEPCNPMTAAEYSSAIPPCYSR
jgi:hypothetical protein